MKAKVSLLLALSMLAMLLVGCTAPASGNTTPMETDPSTTPAEVVPQKTEIRVGGMKGPTSIGMVHLMEQNSLGTATNKYTFRVVGSAPDELVPMLVKDELDIAALPANLAAVQYNRTGKVQLLAVNTLGVIYLVEKGETLTDIADVKGKTVYAFNKGAVTEYALRHILSENGIDPDTDVTIEWKADATEVIAALKQSEGGIAMMPQPIATQAQSKVEGLRIAIDLDAEWRKIEESPLITGVLVVRKAFAETNPAAVAAFLEEYKASTEYVNTHVAESAAWVEKYGIFAAAVAEKAIPYCNITYMAGEEMETAMETYLTILHGMNPNSVGGKLPDAGFYYHAETP